MMMMMVTVRIWPMLKGKCYRALSHGNSIFKFKVIPLCPFVKCALLYHSNTVTIERVIVIFHRTNPSDVFGRDDPSLEFAAAIGSLKEDCHDK